MSEIEKVTETAEQAAETAAPAEKTASGKKSTSRKTSSSATKSGSSSTRKSGSSSSSAKKGTSSSKKTGEKAEAGNGEKKTSTRKSSTSKKTAEKAEAGTAEKKASTRKSSTTKKTPSSDAKKTSTRTRKPSAKAEAAAKAAEEARIAAEKEARLAEKKAASWAAAEAEAVRIAREKEAARVAAKLEAERLAAEEAARLAAEREARLAEKKAASWAAAEAEAVRVTREKEAVRIAAKREAERLAAEEAARHAAEEAARLAAEEEARLAAEKAALAKKKKKRRIALGVVAAVLALLAGGGYYGYRRFLDYHNSLPYTVTDVRHTEGVSEDGTVSFTVDLSQDEYKAAGARYAVTETPEFPAADSSEWKPVEGGEFTFEVGYGHHYVHVSDENGVPTEDEESLKKLSGVYYIDVEPKMNYLAIGAIQQFTFDYIAIGDCDTETVEWTLSDDSLAEIKNNAIFAKAPGDLKMVATLGGTASGEANVLITDLITLPDMDSLSKPLLDSKKITYTYEEEALLDQILFDRVEKAGGYGTRGGVIAAARFLCLEFPYRVPYFFENGRLNPNPGRWYADGEGRYYHKGLYLTDAKYADLDPKGIRFGPAHWGAYLVNWEDKYHFKPGVKYPNGFDCSGFVSWVLLNGGMDYGDVGAGPSNSQFELSDVGDKRKITTELLQSDLIKPGDLIYTDGHMAIILGISEDKIYVAEALFTSVRVTSFKRVKSALPYYLYQYIALMDEEYDKANGQGVYDNMWTWYEGMEDVERYWNYSWW